MIFRTYRRKFPAQWATEEKADGAIKDGKAPFSLILWSFVDSNQRVLWILRFLRSYW